MKFNDLVVHGGDLEEGPEPQLPIKVKVRMELRLEQFLAHNGVTELTAHEYKLERYHDGSALLYWHGQPHAAFDPGQGIRDFLTGRSENLVI